jgi:hypothetical protein
MPRQQEADAAGEQVGAGLEQLRPAEAGVAVDRRHQPGVHPGQHQPHGHEAPRRVAADVGVLAGEGPFAVEPEAEHRAGEAADDVRRLHRHHPFAQRQHQAVFEQPLRKADERVTAEVATQAHGGEPWMERMGGPFAGAAAS